MKVIAIVALCLIAGATAAQVTMNGILRDFTLNHPDFGTYTQAETGAVQAALDQDGKPVLNAGAHTSFFGTNTYSMWYRDTANINIDFSLFLTLESGSGSTYVYSNSNFYPVDNMGWGNEGASGHNLYFTVEFDNFFTYNGGETFSFTSQDDMWIFINGALVIDMGGVHAPTPATANLVIDSLGLQSGSEVNIKICYAQRHNGGSAFGISTNALLQNFPSGDPIPVPGRDALVCEVLYENFCPGEPVGQPDSGDIGPSKKDSQCPQDPTFTFPGGDEGVPNRVAGLEYGFENFNLISFDNFFCPSGDVEGRLAVRNNLNVNDFSVGYQIRSGGVTAWDASLPFSVVVGHDATWTSGAVYPDGSGSPYAGAEEDIFVGGNFQASADLTARRTGGPCAGCLDEDFDNAQAYYSSLSDAFAAVADNAIATIQYTEFKLTCSDSTLFSYSVTVDAADFSTVTYYTVIGCNRFAQIVINIIGSSTTVVFQGDDIPHDPESVLYNIIGSKLIKIQTQVNGNILSPNSQYVQAGMGVVYGQVIVGNVQQAHQINRVHCVNPGPGPHPPSNDDLCPSFEANCLGLDFPLNSGVYSFRDFNVISFGSFVANTGDIEGRLAVRDSVSLGAGYSIGYMLSTANNQPDNSLPYSLIAGRDVSWSSGSLHPDGTGIPFPGNREDIFAGTSFTSPQNDLTARATGNCGEGTDFVEGCLDRYFDSAKQCYEGYQAALQSQPDNVDQTVEWSGLFLTCQDASASVYFVTLTPETMSQYTYTSVDNCNFQAFWVINIAGSGPVSITGDSFPAVCGGVVYNVEGSGRTITVTETSVCGHILAPDNILYQPGGVIVGKVVADDITMSLQINKQDSCPNPGTVNLPTASSTPAPEGQNFIIVAHNGNIQANDVVTIGSQSKLVVSIEGNIMNLNSPLESDVPAGSLIVATVSNANGRPVHKENDSQSSSNKNSASSVAVVASFVLALVALAL